MWRRSDFDGDRQSVKGTDSSITQIVERSQRKISDVDVSEVRTRTAMVKLTSRRTGASFLAVSWHGPWSGKEGTQRLETFHGLIRFLQEVREMKYVSVSSFIIGGDFTLNTKDDLPQLKGVTISRYKLCARDENRLAKSLQQKHGRPFTPYRDTFIVSVAGPSDKCPMTGDITVFSVEPLDLNDESQSALLDHVPVVGTLKLNKRVRTYPSIFFFFGSEVSV